MMERLRYAVASTLLPSGFTPRWGIGGGAAWYFAPCLSFNPRYLMNKRSYTDRKQLDLSERNSMQKLRALLAALATAPRLLAWAAP